MTRLGYACQNQLNKTHHCFRESSTLLEVPSSIFVENSSRSLLQNSSQFSRKNGSISGGRINVIHGFYKDAYRALGSTLELTISIVLLLWAIGFAILPQAPTTWFVGISVAFFGTGQGMLKPTTQLWVGELVPTSLRGRITSYLGSFGLLGQFLSPIILNPIASLPGLDVVFLVTGLTCGLLLLMFIVIFRQ